MDFLNNDISDAAIIRSLCQHNKMHIQEIDRLQRLNKELEELVAQLRTKLEALEAVEEVFDSLEQDTQYTDKEMKAVVCKLDYIKSIKEHSKNTQKNLSHLKKEHARLLERFAKLDLWQSEMENKGSKED
jgi:DNA repair ATPase RecN